MLPYSKLNLIQGSDEWKLARMKYLTASQVPVALGFSDRQTPLQLFEEKITGVEPEYTDFERELFKKGHAAEVAGREWVKDNLKLNLWPLVVVSEVCPDLLASLDGFDEEKRTGFEAKFVGRERFKEIDSGKIPDSHLYQMQSQLLATGGESWLYFVMNEDGDAVHHTIRPNKELFSSISTTARSFMERVRKGEAPDPCDRDIVMVQDDRFEELFELKKMMDSVERKYESLKTDLLKAYDSHPRIRCGDVSITRSFRKGSVDYGKIPQLKGVDLEQFRKKPTASTLVTFKKG